MDGIRLLVIGVGANIWKFHALGVEAIGARVVGVFARRSEIARQRAEELGCVAARSLDELLAIDADAAVILAPHPVHADLAEACFAAGLHVLCEKPLADNVADADRMLAAARRSGKQLVVALQQRTRSEVVEAHRLVTSGELGELQRLDVLSSWPRRHSYFDTSSWRGTWRGEGGGILINQAQHDLDLLCLLGGLPSGVFGRTANAFHGRETEDTASALLWWPNGAFGSVHVSTAEDDEPQRVEVVGTAGRLRMVPGRLEVWRAATDIRRWAATPGNPYERPPGRPPEVHEGKGGSHREVYEGLAAALDGKEPLVASAQTAIRAVELANAITQSSFTGREESLPLDRAAYGQLLEQLRTGPADGALSGVR